MSENESRMSPTDRLYRLPLLLRGTEVQGNGHRYKQWRTVDGIGLQVVYRGDQSPSDQTIRGHLIGQESREMYVVASSVTEALEKLRAEPGYRTGNGEEERRGLRLNPELSIMELPGCPYFYDTQEHGIVCTAESENPDIPPPGDAESYRGCVIEDYEAPGQCPVFPVMAQEPRRVSRPVEFRGRTYQFIPLEQVVKCGVPVETTCPLPDGHEGDHRPCP